MHLDDRLLEDAVGGGVGDHKARELLRMLGSLGSEVGHVDVAVVVASDGDDAHPAHCRRGGVGAVGGDRDEADVAMSLPC